MSNKQSSVRIAAPSQDEAALLRVLTPAEKLAVLVEAARRKVTKPTK
jgi:uncharacterized membrane protein